MVRQINTWYTQCRPAARNTSKISNNERKKPNIKRNSYYQIIYFLSNLITTKTKCTNHSVSWSISIFIGVEKLNNKLQYSNLVLSMQRSVLEGSLSTFFPVNHLWYKNILLSQSSISFRFLISFCCHLRLWVGKIAME